jgi:hypothetical protein
VTSGSDLGPFADNSFDFVYSYVVFQHIPSKEIVLSYLREAQRVLRAGGVLCCQLRGTAPLPSEMSRESETWTGCFFNSTEIADFAGKQSFPLVALSGLDTQYMWTTFRKPQAGGTTYQTERIRVKATTAASGPDARIPARGREAAVSLWIDGMPDSASLVDCTVWFGDREQLGCYISPVSESGGCQLNARLPDGLAPADYQVQLKVCTQPAPVAHTVTVLAPPPRAPRVISVTDGINLASCYRIEAGGAKVVIEDVARPGDVSFTVAGKPPEYVLWECLDPITSTWVYSFHISRGTPRGRQLLSVRADNRELGPIELEMV